MKIHLCFHFFLLFSTLQLKIIGIFLWVLLLLFFSGFIPRSSSQRESLMNSLSGRSRTIIIGLLQLTNHKQGIRILIIFSRALLMLPCALGIKTNFVSFITFFFTSRIFSSYSRCVTPQIIRNKRIKRDQEQYSLHIIVRRNNNMK